MKGDRPIDVLQGVSDMFGDLYLWLSKDGICRDCGIPRSGILPATREQLVGSGIDTFLPPAVAVIVRDAVRDCRETSDVVPITFELDTRHGRMAFEARMIRLLDGDVVLQVHDATFTFERESMLRDSEARMRNLITRLPLGLHVWRAEPDGRLVLVSANPAADEIVGISHEARYGMDVADAFPPCAEAGMREVCRRIAIEGGEHHDARFRFKGGSVEGVFDVTVFQTAPGEVAALFSEVSEQERTAQREAAYRERLRALAVEISEIEERERRRLAEDLHDRVAQALAVCRMYLRQAQASPEPDSSSVDQAISLLDEATREVRALVTELFPPVLHELGLPSAVKWLCDESYHLYGMPCTSDVCLPADVELEEHQRMLVFRAARELLFNVKKHADATSASLALYTDADEVVLAVDDDGTGFDGALVVDSSDGGFGLFSLRERAERLSGSLTIERSGFGGSRVVVRVPCV